MRPRPFRPARCRPRCAHAGHKRETPTSRPMIDAQALMAMFDNATAQKGAQLRNAATEATLAALHGRER